MIDPSISEWSSAIGPFAIGLAVASAPGPVQGLVVSEAMRGGIRRGLAAAAGAAVSFGLLLLLVVFGMSIAAPTDNVVRLLQAIGGLALLWFAFDGYRSWCLWFRNVVLVQPRVTCVTCDLPATCR